MEKDYVVLKSFLYWHVKQAKDKMLSLIEKQARPLINAGLIALPDGVSTESKTAVKKQTKTTTTAAQSTANK